MECEMCFDVIDMGADYEMKCSHKYHKTCLQVFIEQKEKNTNIHCCPLCSKPYNAKNLQNQSFDSSQKSEFQRIQLVEFKANTTCVVCLEEYSETNLPYEISTCSHLFHKECIYKWHEECGVKNKDGNCPSCRKNFEEHHIKLRNDVYKKILQLSAPEFQVFVKDLGGNSIIFDVTSQTTVEQFFEMCFRRFGVAKEQMRFSVNSKTISYNQKTEKLSKFGVISLSVLNLLLRMNGGFSL